MLLCYNSDSVTPQAAITGKALVALHCKSCQTLSRIDSNTKGQNKFAVERYKRYNSDNLMPQMAITV
jgi:hypothetical protein